MTCLCPKCENSFIEDCNGKLIKELQEKIEGYKEIQGKIDSDEWIEYCNQQSLKYAQKLEKENEKLKDDYRKAMEDNCQLSRETIQLREALQYACQEKHNAIDGSCNCIPNGCNYYNICQLDNKEDIEARR